MVTFFVIYGVSCTLNSVFARGIAAGTKINNKATVYYSINNIEQAPLESSPTGNSVAGIDNGMATSFKVDRKIDLSLTGNTNAKAKPGDQQVKVTYTLINEGNDTQEFGFITDSSLQSDDFDIQNCTTRVVSISGTALAGVTVPTTGNITLKADQQAEITVNCDIPDNNMSDAFLSGQTSLVSLIATAEKNSDGSKVKQSNTEDNTMEIETVFADDAGSDDGVRDASHSARRSYTISPVDPLSPVAVNDKSLDNEVGKSIVLDPVANDNPDGIAALDLSSLILLGTGVDQSGKTKIVKGEGIWHVNPTTAQLTFTPDANLSGNPSPVSYTIKDTKGHLSNQATISITYKQTEAIADLIIDKSIVRTVNTDGSNKASKGAVVTYRIKVTTTGKGIIENTVITDLTPTGMSYKPESIYLNNQHLTDSADIDKANFGVSRENTVTVNLGNISAGQSNEILLSYIVN